MRNQNVVGLHTEEQGDYSIQQIITTEVLEAIEQVSRHGFGEVIIKIQHGKVTCIHKTDTIRIDSLTTRQVGNR